MTFFDTVIAIAQDTYNEIERFREENKAKQDRGEAWYQKLGKKQDTRPMTEGERAYQRLVEEDMPLEDNSLDMIGIGKLAGKLREADTAFSSKRLQVPSGDIREGVTKYPTINDYKRTAFEQATRRPTGEEILEQAKERALRDEVMEVIKQRKSDSDKLFYG